MKDRLIYHVRSKDLNHLRYTIGIDYHSGDLSHSLLSVLCVAWSKPAEKNGSKKTGFYNVNTRLDRMVKNPELTYGEPPTMIKREISDYIDRAKKYFKSVDLSNAIIRL